MLRTWLTVLLCVSLLAGFAQQQNDVAILSRSKSDGIWLRWAPVNAVNWQMGNKYGYNLERFTLTSDGELTENSKLVLTPAPLKPLTPAEFLPLSEMSDEIATLGELLYGEGSDSNYSANDLAGILARNNDLENRFGIAMLMCDLSLDAAKAGGLFFKDTKAEKGRRYIYRISLAAPSAPAGVDPSVVVVSYTDEEPLLNISDLSAVFGNRTATLKWPTLLHKGVYTAYYLERSSDGKDFQKLTELPYVHMSELLATEEAVYVDSLEMNHKKYHYRIQGITPFSEIGPYSNVVSGAGAEDVFGKLVLTEGEVVHQNQVKLTWQFPEQLEGQIAGFMVSRANNADGPYHDIGRKTLDKEAREYVDVTHFNNSYYVIKAIDEQGNEITRSFPYLVQIEDNTPPAVPNDITGSIAVSGVSILKWTPNTDPDLFGYRVFRSNSAHEEPVEVTEEIRSQPSYHDTVNIRVLNRDVYYYVIAVDRNYNTSAYSKACVLARPDIIPPTAPVFTRVELSADSIMLEWVNSVSNDVARYELTRIEKDNRLKRLVNTWYPIAPVQRFADGALTPGASYAYKVTVYDSTGNTSDAVSRHILYEPGFRSAVSGIKSTVDRENRRIVIQWKNPLPGVRCMVYRKINSNPYTLYKTLQGNVETFTDESITINNHYSYKIQPVFGKGIKARISEGIKVIY